AQRPDRITGVPTGGILSVNSDLFNKADGKITVIEVNKKDEFTTATYGEDSVMKLACRRGSKTSMLSFFSYD
ncbi:hypothetical protein, partial [Klebsiella variicola]|uniref:hypothetical protein n=1 Tax=Klebsiella variicola TaxID=244366 RepID=UPI001D0FB119